MTPAMFLGSCRFKLSNDEEQYEKIINALKKYNIGYFFYIGGNDSMDKAKKYIRIKFKNGEKQFVFPDAFIGGFLSL